MRTHKQQVVKNTGKQNVKCLNDDVKKTLTQQKTLTAKKNADGKKNVDGKKKLTAKKNMHRHQRET